MGCAPNSGIVSPLLITPSASLTSISFTTSSPTSLHTLHPSSTKTETPVFSPTDRPARVMTPVPEATTIYETYLFPIQPAIMADFSEGVASHGYPATDIFAPEGVDFIAVTNGIVDFVSYKDRWDPEQDDPALRGGLSVAIIGVDGVRYYGSHLSSIAVGISPGVPVTAGQVLGYIGHTGNSRNTESHLHFGISRPSFPEDWRVRRGQVDPFPFLVAWRKGISVTPPLPTP
jgi:murein DD-endopeptidase MepM/ murein hydrolase activator NlpD